MSEAIRKRAKELADKHVEQKECTCDEDDYSCAYRDSYHDYVRGYVEGMQDPDANADSIEERKRLEAQLKEAREVISFYASEDTRVRKEINKDGDLIQWWDKTPNDKSILPFKIGTSTGNFNYLGRRARAYLEKWEE